MAIRSGNRSAEPARVIQRGGKRPALEVRKGLPAKPGPIVGMPEVVRRLERELSDLKRRVSELEQSR